MAVRLELTGTIMRRAGLAGTLTFALLVAILFIAEYVRVSGFDPRVRQGLCPRLLITVASWYLAAPGLVLLGAVTSGATTGFVRFSLMFVAWASAAILLITLTPYTPQSCFKNIGGGYFCDDQDFLNKAVFICVSLLAPAIWGFFASRRSLK